MAELQQLCWDGSEPELPRAPICPGGRELQVPGVLRSAHDTSFPLNSWWCQPSILQGFCSSSKLLCSCCCRRGKGLDAELQGKERE